MRGAARWNGKAVLGAAELAGIQNRGGGGAARRGEKGRCHEERSGTRGNQGSLAELQSTARAAGGWDKPGTAVAPKLQQSWR